MLHWLVVGHFDPQDRVDRSEQLYKPKPQRPIPLPVAEQALAQFGRDIEPYLSYCEGGYILCNWSVAPYALWERVQEFAYFLAEREEAVVMDEGYMVFWPTAAGEVRRAADGS
jgi:hypothetical protein